MDTTKTYTILILACLLLMLSFLPFIGKIFKILIKISSVIVFGIFVKYNYDVFKKRTIVSSYDLQNPYDNKSIISNYFLMICIVAFMFYIVYSIF